MLLQEEQHIVHWLTEYGALTKTQVIRMLKDKPPQTAEKIIRGLKRELMIHEIAGGYYLGVDPMCQPDQRMKERRPVRRGVPDVGNDAIVDDRFEQIRGSQT